MSARRTCIVVLGMHRSGTSALTRVLSLVGAALPHHLVPANTGNATGHWEPEKLVDFHDALLSELRSRWDDWNALDLAQLTGRRRREIKVRIGDIIAAEYGAAPLTIIKDPRICRFAPLFLEALTDAGITPETVLIFRNPLEVAHSHERRDGMARRDAGLLWLRHVLDAEAATRGRRRALLFYDDLLADWKGELRRILPEIGLGPESGGQSVLETGAAHLAEGVRRDVSSDRGGEAAADIERFLDPAQRHHAPSAMDVLNDSAMSGGIFDVYCALRMLTPGPPPAAALATIDRVRAAFNKSA